MTGPGLPLSRAEAAGLLGVPHDAAAADVQRAFLKAARRVHPDTRPGADETERREAAADFDRLLRARDLLLAVAPAPDARPPADGAVHGGPAGSEHRRAPGRGIGGSLVVLALLSFLLVLLVTLQQGVRGGPVAPSPSAPAVGAEP